MTIKELMELSKLGSINVNKDSAAKYCTKDCNNSFMNILTQASKSYNHSFDRNSNVPAFSDSQQNNSSYKVNKNYNETDYSQNSSIKDFDSKNIKQEYKEKQNYDEKIYRDEKKELKTNTKAKDEQNSAENKSEDKSADNENINKDDNKIEAKTGQNEQLSQNDTEITDAQQEETVNNTDIKDVQDDAQQIKAQEIQPEKAAEPQSPTVVINVAVSELAIKDKVLNMAEQPQSAENVVNKLQVIEKAQKELAETVKTLQSVNSENKEEAEAVAHNELPETEKSDVNKQASALVQGVKNDNATKMAGNKLISDSQPEGNIIEESDNQKAAQVKMLESLTSEIDINQEKQLKAVVSQDKFISNMDKIQGNQLENRKNQSLSDKLVELSGSNEEKPAITQLDIKGEASKMDFGSQSGQHELKAGVNNSQNIVTEGNLQKIDSQKTIQFDKILSSKQAQSTENSILNQVKDKIISDTAENKSQINIILKPENLGRVNINIVSQNGTLTASITAENNQARDILNKNIEVLRQNLSEQGVQVGKVVVQTQEPSTSNQNMNSDDNSRSFEQANSGLQDRNYQSGSQSRSEKAYSSYTDEQVSEFGELPENELVENQAAQENNLNIKMSRVDYKV